MAYTTINKSSDFFNNKLYTGTGSNQSLTGVGFKPDFVWTKNRSENSDNRLFDAIRGALYVLTSNNTDTSSSSADTLTSFDTDGFTLGSSFRVNKNTNKFATWNWKANGAGSANTDGSISSTVSANTTAGFSIVKYTGTGSAGATIGHGLGAKPNVIILKNISNTQQWTSYWSPLGATKFMRFNSDDAVGTASNRWNNTEPTTSLFTVGTDGEVNQSGLNHIAYCFAEKQGYSKFGSYTGNDSTDGPFIYTGFKPAFILGKRTTNAGGWWILDSKRPGVNVTDEYLLADSGQAEADDGSFATDFLSNGFKVRASNGNFNTGGDNYIYMCFAEAPLVGTNNVPANAR